VRHRLCLNQHHAAAERLFGYTAAKAIWPPPNSPCPGGTMLPDSALWGNGKSDFAGETNASHAVRAR
jgi:hypothetical protein